QSGLQFRAGAGSGTVQTQSVAVSNAGAGVLSFTAAASSSSKWLSVSPASGTISSGSTQVSIQANPSGLGPGIYSGLVQFTGPGVVNGTQTVEVVLVVSASAAAASLSANALVFVANAGSNPAPQVVQVFNPGNQTLTVNPSIGFARGSGWFTSTATGTTTTSSQPLMELVSVNTTNLLPGAYLGSLNLHIVETNTDELVEILLIVKSTSCTPTRLLPVLNNLGGDFQAIAGFPVPLDVHVVDDCGNPVNSGAVMAYFPNGDPGVPLTAQGQGQWSGTWLPHS